MNGHGDGDGDGARAGTGTGVEVNEGAQDRNGGGSGDGAGTGTGVTRRRTPDGNGDVNEDRIGEGERKATMHKKPQNSCRRQVGNGRDLGGKRKKCRKERVGAVAAIPDNLESNKEAGEGAQGTQEPSKNLTSKERVCPLCRV